MQTEKGVERSIKNTKKVGYVRRKWKPYVDTFMTCETIVVSLVVNTKKSKVQLLGVLLIQKPLCCLLLS